MKILLINTDDNSGGAAIACSRLYEALLKNKQVSVKMLVQEKKGKNDKIEGFAQTWWQKKSAFLRFVQERLFFFFFEKSKEIRFAFSPANVGVDISQHPLVQEADILHLHWINFGFLSVDSLGKLLALGKPIVWTLHDMWAFTGGCHHSGNCENYQGQCGNCVRFLKNPSESDLSHQIWQRKNTIFQANPIHVVPCSIWLANRASKSSLFQKMPIQVIPNPLNTILFKPISKQEAKQKLGLPIDKKLLLFAAMKTSVIWKGFDYFKSSLEVLKKQLVDNQAIELLILGEIDAEVSDQLPFKTHALGRISEVEKIVLVYNAADVFVIPSLEENLPNTIMEAMACGTPAVGFETGGIPEMIEHQKTGFLAKYKSSEELAAGIQWTLFESNYEKLCQNARQKVLENYDEAIVAQKYIDLYTEINEIIIKKK